MAGVRTFLVCVCLYGSSSFYDGCTYIPVCEVSSFCKFSFIILVFLEIFLFVSVYFSVFVCFWVRFSLRSPGWPQIQLSFCLNLPNAAITDTCHHAGWHFPSYSLPKVPTFLPWTNEWFKYAIQLEFWNNAYALKSCTHFQNANHKHSASSVCLIEVGV